LPRFRIDRLDKRLIEAIRKEGPVLLRELAREYPEFEEVHPSTLYYRINSLDHDGRIKVERLRRGLMCYPIEG
jgi:DNA-binding Lrp family transcriptional regulator